MKAKHSISRVYRVIALIFVPTVFLAFFFSLHIRNKMSEQAVYLFSSRISSALNEQNRKFSSINNLLLDQLFNNEIVTNLRNGTGNREVNLRSLRADLLNYSGYFDRAYDFFLYDSSTDVFISTADALEYDSGKLKTAFSDIMADHNSEVVSNSRWDILEYEPDKFVIYNMYRSPGIMMGSFISLKGFYNQFYVNQEGGQEYMFLIHDETFIDPVQTEVYEKVTHHADIVVQKNQEVYRNLTYWVQRKNIEPAEFDAIFAANVMGNYGWAQVMIYGLLIIDLVVLAIGIWLLSYIRKRLILPLNTFVEKFSQDDTDAGSEDFPVAFEEIKQVDAMFERAEKQIEALKIEVYEKELEQQKMELSFLQSQVHPHFYLNNMSVFYGMAEAGRTKEIQQLSMEIAAYFRFLLRDGTTLVLLSQELDHVQRYLNIYQIRYEDELNYTVTCDPDCQDALVPPLMIQTMVENSFKYAREADQVLTISVKIEKINKSNKEFLEIVISDNGPGFPEKILEDIKNGVTIEGRDGYGIGLSNTIRRIHFFYPDEGSVTFLNGKYEGAIVRITIPYQTRI